MFFNPFIVRFDRVGVLYEPRLFFGLAHGSLNSGLGRT
jgi:hypothetical protein